MPTENTNGDRIQVSFTKDDLYVMLDLVQSQTHTTQALLHGLDRHEREGLLLEVKLAGLHRLEERILRGLGVKLY